MSGNAALCSSISSGLSLFLILFGLVVFRKEVCRKVPTFPLLCSSGKRGTRGGNVGTAAIGTTGKANMTAFGWSGDDNGEGFTGIDLHKFGTAGYSFQGKPLYPIAVFMANGAAYLWKVLEVRAPGLPKFYGVVVDLCDSGQEICKAATSYGGVNFLIDIHITAFTGLGISEARAKSFRQTGEYTVVGHLKPTDLPASAYMPAVASGTDYMVCSCTGTCTVKEATWKPYGTC
jgi:hypothetical protein